MNRYAYVGGNPVGAIDPTGEIAFLAAPAVPAILAGVGSFIGGGSAYYTANRSSSAVFGEISRYGGNLGCYNYENILYAVSSGLPISRGFNVASKGSAYLGKTGSFASGGPQARGEAGAALNYAYEQFMQKLGFSVAMGAIREAELFSFLNLNGNCECQNEPSATPEKQNSSPITSGSPRGPALRPIEPKGPSGFYIPRPGYDPVLDPNVSIVTLRALRGR